MLVRAAVVLASLLLGACTGAPAPAREDAPRVPQALLPFADACTFLLPGFDSLSLSTEHHTSFVEDTVIVVRRARVGGTFERPPGLGFGAYRGIEVHDFGGSGLRHCDPESGPPTETIGDVPVWRVAEPTARDTGEPTSPEVPGMRWEARVADRHRVWSRDRALLVRALERRGGLAELLQPFAAVQAIPDDVDAVVCTLPRPTDATYWGRMVPVETVVACCCVQRQRVLLWHRVPLPPDYIGSGGRRAVVRRDGEWSITEVPFELSLEDPWYRVLIDMLFGLAIFI